MAEHDRDDDDLSRRYRELAREEPPRALDDAILAAARREVEARPAPLVAPTGRRRWFVPVAAAAVIVLSAVVTLHVQREQPDAELDAPQIAQAPATRKDEAPAVAPRAEMREKLYSQSKEAETPGAQPEAAQAQPERRRAQPAPSPKPATPSQAPAGESSALARAPAEPKPSADQERFTPDPAPAAAAPPPPPPPASAPQMQMQPPAPAAKPAPRAAESASAAAGAAPPAVAEDRQSIGGLRDGARFDSRAALKREIQAEPPEKMLERIAALRREGRSREADDLYAEFKRRFPDHRIPDALREQVVPR